MTQQPTTDEQDAQSAGLEDDWPCGENMCQCSCWRGHACGCDCPRCPDCQQVADDCDCPGGE